ncbi:MAG: hypothetical protein CMJ27_02410 [Phycisphaerae bacterium]|nr:hypothetical protein [Phycisphaerae bacterium]OUX02804.1 MAG: hypothetical protein CBD91_01740 [Phycisphaeraceae bacterium TMED231]
MIMRFRARLVASGSVVASSIRIAAAWRPEVSSGSARTATGSSIDRGAQPGHPSSRPRIRMGAIERTAQSGFGSRPGPLEAR